MNRRLRRPIALGALGIAVALVLSGLYQPRAQMLGPAPGAPSPQSQRQALQQLQMRVQSLESATRSASMFGQGADAVLWRHYEGVCAGFADLTRSLYPQQWDYGANDLAELDAGLAIIREAFDNFQDDLNRGRSPTVAFHTLSQVLRDSMRVWKAELNRVSKRLQVGR